MKKKRGRRRRRKRKRKANNGRSNVKQWDLFCHLVFQNLLFVKNFESHRLPSLRISSKLDFCKCTLTDCPTNLVFTNPTLDFRLIHCRLSDSTWGFLRKLAWKIDNQQMEGPRKLARSRNTRTISSRELQLRYHSWDPNPDPNSGKFRLKNQTMQTRFQTRIIPSTKITRKTINQSIEASNSTTNPKLIKLIVFINSNMELQQQKRKPSTGNTDKAPKWQ